MKRIRRLAHRRLITPRSAPNPPSQLARAGLAACLAAACLLLAPPTPAAQPPVANGLMLWLRADTGVATNSAGKVTAWTDQSPNAHVAGQRLEGNPSELPLWIANVVNGKPAIRFDGVTNVLEIANSPALQPLDGNWTVIFVAQRGAASQGDFPQIIGSRPWVAGLDKGWAVAISSSGTVCSHYADGSAGHDVPGTLALGALSRTAFEMWQVEENRTAGTTVFYQNGDLNVTRISAMPTATIDQTENIYLGREIGGSNNRRANLDLAEVLVYNRILTQTERETVSLDLSTRYGLGYTINAPPQASVTAPAPNASFPVPATLTLTATASDTDGSVRRVEFYEGASLIATATQPPYSVPIQIESVGSFQFSAVAVDNRSGAGASTPVSITVTGSLPETPMNVSSGLRLWLKADAGVTADGASVSAWADQSPNGNHATQDNGAAQPPDSWQPTLVADGFNGKPIIRFDGLDDFMMIPNSASLQPMSGDWTVFFAAQRGTASRGDYPQIIGSRPWNAGLDKGWAFCFNSAGLVGSHFADGTAGHDVAAALSATPLSSSAAEVWQIEESRSAGATAFYALGRTNRVLQTAMPTTAIDQANAIYVGSEVEGADNRRANLDLAEVLIYGRTLSESDRTAVTTYLLRKYAVRQLFQANQAPTVALTAPAEGVSFTAPARFTMTADASDADGSISRVEFFSGAASLGIVTNSPYQLAVILTTPGNLALTAVATDNLGATKASAPVTIRVTAPNVTLIGKVDYSDSFTTNAIRRDGLYNNNTEGAYSVEKNEGNPAATWTPTSNYSFNTPASSTDPAKVGAAIGNAGANSGLAQSGGGDFNFAYGLQANYVIQLDAIFPSDRLDVSSLAAAGDNIFAANSLTVFLRRDSVAGTPHAAFPDTGLPGIGLFNGSKETAVTNAQGQVVKTGVNDNNWHNVAIQFDQPNSILRIHVDGIPVTSINLATFAGGLYQNYANGAVGAGGAGGVFWIDNFKVGAPPKLIETVDYRDTFTINEIRTDGLYNDNSAGAYAVEDTRGNPEATWTPTSNFSFNTPGSSTDPARLEAALGNAGAVTGFAQSGGNDFSFAYAVRDSYVVQFDAILPTDRLDVTSLAEAGGGIFGTDKLSIFFRRDSTAGSPHAAFPDTGLPGMGLYNGSTETAVVDEGGNMILTGVDDDNWHNYAVHFDHPNHQLKLYVDRSLKVTLDLASFAGGIYLNYSYGAVGMGGAGGVFWMDNFEVGAPPAAPQVIGPLAVKLEQGKVVISWTTPGTLESASNASGPWAPEAGAASPYSVTPSDRKFFRLKN